MPARVFQLTGVCLIFVLLYAVTPSTTNAASLGGPAETQETARLLALLLDSGRIVLAEHQRLINDAAKGEKGFSADVFEADLIQEFKRRSGGIDLAQLDVTALSSMAKSLLHALLAAGKEVIHERQTVINEKYLGYKNVIPATWGTWTSQKFSQRNRVLLKQTALDFRNPNNAPNEFETRVLQKFASPDYPREGERVFIEVTDEGTTLRLMLPLYHKKDCLTCHGQPKGQIDISGYLKEGHEEGGPAGAISVALPMTR
jgi:Protein of unknown function (DUF3365)